jgi:hypothetical protein
MNVTLKQLVKEEAQSLLDAASREDWTSVKRIAKVLQEDAEILILDDLYSDDPEENYSNK